MGKKIWEGIDIGIDISALEKYLNVRHRQKFSEPEENIKDDIMDVLIRYVARQVLIKKRKEEIKKLKDGAIPKEI